MTSTRVTVVNEFGLHLRAAARIVSLTNRYPCQIWLQLDNTTVDAKSLLGITSLLARRGTTLTVTADGDAADEAVSSVSALIASGFAEQP